MTDFIIVGQGLAANVLAHTFHQHNISFKLIGNEQLSSCSKVAAGIWNPVVFKRLTKSWLADDLVPCLNEFYTACETRLNKKIITRRPIIKPFTEEQEKQLWLKKAAAELQGFLDTDIYKSITPELAHCNIKNGYGEVLQSGNLNVADFLNASAVFFKAHFISATFNHNDLRVTENKVTYHELEARHIIFCEGYLVRDNPFFNWIPLKPAKGEVLTIAAKDLKLHNQVFNKNGFLMDIGEGTYKTGATYAWDDMTQEPTEGRLTELHDKIRQMISCDYSVVKHEAGIRPSSTDRRPVIGEHPVYKNLYVFNGLGTKGVMLAPYFAKNFVNFYLQSTSLHSDVNVNRFYNLYAAQKT